MAFRRGTSAQRRGGESIGPRQRFGLLFFGAVLAALFVPVAIVEGVGRPDVPADAVAIVEETPSGTRTIPVADFRREMRRVGVEAGLGRAPRPGDENYEELRETVLTSMLTTVWIEGLADEMGVSVRPIEVDETFREYREKFLAKDAVYRQYLAETGQTTADVKNNLRVGLLRSKIAREAHSRIAKPPLEEIEAYYQAARSTAFTRDPTRDVRLVVVKDRVEANEVKELLDRDHSGKGWTRTAEKYLEDQGARERGGLFERLTDENLWEPLGDAFFAAPLNRVEGPLKTPVGYYVFEVVRETPGNVEPLDEAAASRIRSELRGQAFDDVRERLQYDFESRWRARTICAAGYMVEICGNFDGSLRPPAASSACYEAEPAKARPPCPAPVRQLQPALPGSVSPLEPQGEQLAQRPRPVNFIQIPEPRPAFPAVPQPSNPSPPPAGAARARERVVPPPVG